MRDYDKLCDDLNKLFDAANMAVIPPLQERQEILWAIDIAKTYSKEFAIIVEIGSWWGGNLVMLSYLLENEGLLISIETEEVVKLEVDKVREITGIDLYHIKKPSGKAFADLAYYLDGRLIDLLFYDAGDRYEDIRDDYALYSPLIKQGGLWMMHDISRVGGGPKFWSEISKDRPCASLVVPKSEEFIRNCKRAGKHARHTGIGILPL
jgi:predicted O-methyltransferase YrrM